MKYMLPTSSDMRRIGSQIATDNCTFNVLSESEFVYFGSVVGNKNDFSLEIKLRITLPNRCYFGLKKQLISRDLSHTTKLITYTSRSLSPYFSFAEA